MKIVYNTILLTLLFLATSCDHSEKIDDIKLEISQNIFRNIDNNGGKITVAITSNSEWIIANSADWCIPDKYQGEGNDILTIKILANTKHANRQTNLIISAQGINQTIKISQQKGEVNPDLDKIHYQLPVIFHVLYQNENDINQYIKEDHLKDVLVRTNHFYQSEKCGIDINLEFVLATKDKNGTTLPEPGVERVPFNELPIDCEKFMRDNTGKYTSLLWEPNEYINIMVYPFTDSQILGISTFPYSLKDFFLEGTQQVSASWITLENLSFPYCISINSSYIYEQSTDERINQNDAAITLAHELGHYLGLRHVFSEGGTTSMCTDTDYCKDTPSYNRSEYEQWLNNLDKQNKYQLKDLAKRYSCEKGEYEAHNIMDYAYCFYNEITLEQRKRIRHILNYSPLIPGPKESRIDTRGVQGRLNLPICIMK